MEAERVTLSPTNTPCYSHTLLCPKPDQKKKKKATVVKLGTVMFYLGWHEDK